MTINGHELDTSDLVPQFTPYLHTGQRIRVQRTYDSGYQYTRTGTVGKTTGWKPCYLLMSRSSAIGSSDCLSREDTIIAVKKGRKYVGV